MKEEAVRIDNSSSSRVVAPSYRPAMVFKATRIGSTSAMPSQQRVTARTILFTSMGSCAPERFVTLIGGRGDGGGFRLNSGWWVPEDRSSALDSVPAPGEEISDGVCVFIA